LRLVYFVIIIGHLTVFVYNEPVQTDIGLTDYSSKANTWFVDEFHPPIMMLTARKLKRLSLWTNTDLFIIFCRIKAGVETLYNLFINFCRVKLPTAKCLFGLKVLVALSWALVR
jgi:hypothetical protein